MFRRKLFRSHGALMRVGFACLIAASISVRYASALPGVSPDVADAITGLLYGVAIGSLLMSLRARKRSS
jgi:hypothetical protein